MDEKPITPFDDFITPSSLQLLKLCIPYIPPEKQKTLAIYEKYLELQSTYNFYQKNNRSIHMQSDSSTPFSLSNIFEKIGPYLDENEKEMFRSISNAMDMMEMFQEYQNMEEENGKESMEKSSDAEEYECKETRSDTDSC